MTAMINAILFDLDDTLLENDIQRFLPAYLSALGEFMGAQIDPERLTTALMTGTQAMLKNNDPEVTLREAFEATFYPLVGVERGSLTREFERFYHERFPALSSLTKPVEGSAAVVELAFRRRWKVAVATNPLFPREAIAERLAWAGLDSGRFPFDYVTSFEEMHFAKPRAEFVAEALAHLAALPEDSLFVGNDPQEDIAPARKLGTASFRAVPGGTGGDGAQAGEGTFRTLLDALDAEGGDEPAFPPAPASPCALPARLAGDLAALRSMFAGSGWAACPAEEGWGPVDIACHLRDVECEIMQARLSLVLTEENPYLAPVESDRWAEERNYRGQDGPAALREFTRLRKQTIARLKDLGEADWQRPARHALFGPTTLEEQTRFIARHDLLHVEQLQAAKYACRE